VAALEGEEKAYSAQYLENELQRIQAVRDAAREAEQNPPPAKTKGAKGASSKVKAKAPSKALGRVNKKPVVDEEEEEEEGEEEEE
jgi:hypothetical protein